MTTPVSSEHLHDMVLNGNRQSVQFLIFSQKYDEIADRIIHELGRMFFLADVLGTGIRGRDCETVVYRIGGILGIKLGLGLDANDYLR